MADQMAEQQDKRDIQMVEHTTTTDDQMPTKDDNPLMRSKADDFSVWQSAIKFKRVGFICMAAAFCAALDGYRKTRLCYTGNSTSERTPGADSACAQRLISTAASLLIRDSSSSSLALEQRSSWANTSPPGVAFSLLASSLAKLCVFQLRNCLKA
jgi:hypothetical protein